MTDMRLVIFILALAVIIGGGILLLNKPANAPALPVEPRPAKTDTMLKLTSPAFVDAAKLPKEFTCDSAGISPALEISGAAAEAKSLALTLIDPDAPGGMFTHWLIWNIDPAATRIEQGNVPAGALQGSNDFGKLGFGPPCPPNGSHRYIFTLYALDAKLDLSPGADLQQLLAAITGRVISSAVLTALYR